jgi:acyl-coenzyme A thioesterase PaaI-like protein
MGELLTEHCRLDESSPGVFERNCDRTWWGHDALFGGYVEALALIAMTRALDSAVQAPQSMTMHFLRPFVDGRFRAETTVERTGRNMSTVTARLHSEGKLAGFAIASFGTRREFNEFIAVHPPEATPVQEGERPVVSPLGVPNHKHFDMFPRIGTFARGGGDAHVGGWVRGRELGPIDHAMIPVLADLWIPAAYHRWHEPTPAVSVDITTHFRAALPRADVTPESVVFVDLRTTGSIGGFVDEDVSIWSDAGVLLAQSRQMRFVHALPS